MFHNVDCIGQSVGPEKDPGKRNQVEGGKDFHPGCNVGRQGEWKMQAIFPPARQHRNHHEQAMQRAPDNKRPVSTVPESAGEHRRHGRKYETKRALEVHPAPVYRPTDRIKDVVPEPVIKADVPSSPEINYGLRVIRLLKILLQLEAHNPGSPDCDVRVSRKVAIDLESKCIGDEDQDDTRI